MVSVPLPVVKGSVELDGEWQAVTDENRAEMRFFRVEVVCCRGCGGFWGSDVPNGRADFGIIYADET